MSGPAFDDIRYFASIDSTNQYLLAEARAGAPEGIVAVADFQTAGRGRLGRAWEAPPGACLLCSILLRPDVPTDRLSLVTGVVALAALEAIDELYACPVGLKWPNDLVVDGAKLAGILAESESTTSAVGAVVVGIGCNLTWPGPEGAGGTSLEAQGATGVDRDRLLKVLLARLGSWRQRLDDGAGRDLIAAELRRRCDTLGQPVRVELGTETFSGTAVDLTSAGHLVVDTPVGRREVAVGDVVHLRSAPVHSGPGQSDESN